MRRPALYEELAGLTVEAVGEALGLTRGRGGLGPCPCCGADRRGGVDPRLPLRVFKGSTRWRCSACDAGGDVAALVLAVATGAARSDDPAAWARAREAAEGAGLTAGGVRVRPLPPAAPGGLPGAVARLPPADELAALWAACAPVSRCAEAAAWFDRRGLDLAAVERLDLARVCPAASWRGWNSTTWARCSGRSWGAGWRLVLPGFDARGELVTLRARWVLPDEPPIGSKEIAPAGFDAGPALYADGKARAMLVRSGAARVLVIVEGGPTWLRYAVEAAARPDVAIVGLWAGAWSGAHAGRLAAAGRWTVATDDDEAGDRYAAAVFADAEVCGVKATRWRAGR